MRKTFAKSKNDQGITTHFAHGFPDRPSKPRQPHLETIMRFSDLKFIGTLTALSLASVAGQAIGNDTDSGEKLPVVYTVEMNGQMGTDIHEDMMAKIVEDAKEVQPDVIVLKMNSADYDKNYHLMRPDPKEFGKFELEAYVGMIRNFQNELAGTRQVIWVEDSVGVASLIAMSWCEMYMSPGARLWGLQKLHDVAQNWSDEDVREKMEAAWEGMGKGFFEMGCKGEFAKELGDAMMDPENQLSANFKGRKVIWVSNFDGLWGIDNSEEQVANFDAQSAEDTMLSEGTVESLEDLMFLMGYREFEHNTQGDEIAAKHKQQWRRAYEKCLSTYEDMQAGRGMGNSTDPARQLMARKRMLDDILRQMTRYNAVERRMNDEYGLTVDRLKGMIEQIEDDIRRAREGGRGGRGGSFGGGRGGGGKIR
ncbi:MAG: hypothetical protein CMJ33_05495 [Phycisphaerae bacterium]|nr:hypothetical protein [Phycisphaerae bacterium]